MIYPGIDPGDRIMAVVVTYNPDDGLAQRLERLRGQAAVVVVDNGSAQKTRVRALAEAADCSFVGNDANLGIATALNQGLAFARASGADWLATFDQDSLAPDGGLQALLQTYRTHPTPERIALVAMIRNDRMTHRDYTPSWYILEETAEWRSVKTTLTSGSLVRLAVIDEIGQFDDDLFIDSVDHMFCLKCRMAGFLIIESKAAILSHAMGRAESRSFMGRDYAVLHHHVIRNYYMTRNALKLAVAGFKHDPSYAVRMVLHQAVQAMKVALFEDQRQVKLLLMAEGMRDFFRRRYGPYAGAHADGAPPGRR